MVAIKDMEMPSCCAKCKLCEYNEHIGCYCVANNGGKFTMSREEMKEKRLDDCPLVEIVTCKDCEHCYLDEDGRGYHCERDSNVRFSVYGDFYCKDAERRES